MNIKDLETFEAVVEEQSITRASKKLYITPQGVSKIINPDIEFHYREYPDSQVERLFQEREGNVAFSIADFEEGCYDVSEIETFPIRLLVNTDHPLSQRKSATIEDLRGFDDMKADGLVMIPFSDGEYQWKACMLTRKGEKPGETVELFVAHVREWLSLIRTGVITR